jgi:hypothetical protein
MFVVSSDFVSSSFARWPHGPAVAPGELACGAKPLEARVFARTQRANRQSEARALARELLLLRTEDEVARSKAERSHPVQMPSTEFT